MKETEILQFMAEFLNQERMDPSWGIGDVMEWDSIRHIQMLLALEERFGIAITADQYGELLTARSIVDYLLANEE